jgi:hypothetical protein
MGRGEWEVRKKAKSNREVRIKGKRVRKVRRKGKKEREVGQMGKREREVRRINGGVNRIGINVRGSEKVDGGRKLWNKGRGW